MVPFIVIGSLGKAVIVDCVITINLVRADRLIQVTKVDTFDGQVRYLTGVVVGNFPPYFTFIDLSTSSKVAQRLHNGRVISTSIIHPIISLFQKLASFLIQI
jgi:hypothetical protein